MNANPLSAPREVEPPLMPLLGLFFVSGATGLLYEILWMRRLTLVFGATHLAIATVLAAFMGGLAIGAALGGRLADKRGDLLRIYGLLELGIGAFALLFPALLAAATTVYRSLVAAETAHYAGAHFIHFFAMVLLLVIPTAAMGATLPLLVRRAAGKLSKVGRRAGLLYGFNTAGAVVGTWATGFVMLPLLGVRGTELLAASANLIIGVAALVWGRADAAAGSAALEVEDDAADAAEAESLLEIVPDPDLSPDRRRRVRVWVLGSLAVSGACTMVFEVAWSRFLALILGSSVYAFTLMLVAFLLGTAGGALVGSSLVSRPGARPLRWLPAALGMAALTAFGTNHLFPSMPFLYVDWYKMIDGHDSLLLVGQWLFAVLVMTPTTFCIGLTFPMGAAVVADRADAVGRDVSRLYVLNTTGAVVGSLLAGFVLMPQFGIQETLVVAVLAESAAAIALITTWVAPVRTRTIAAILASFAALGAMANRPAWDPLLMSAGMYKYVSELSDFSHEAVRNYALSDFELLYYSEGTTSTVTVARSAGSGNIWLANNGKVDASSQQDLRTQVMLGHLPFLVKPDAKTALVVGLASGVTSGSVTLQPDLERIDVLEIEPAVITASHYFDLVNHRPLEDERLRVIPNDARNHLVLYDDVYDVIINEPSNPWISGVSNLFTKEFLELGRSKLSVDGIFCQWVQIYGMGSEDLQSLLATFADVFPRVSAWYSVEDSDVLLLGSRASVDVWSADLGAYMQGPRGQDLQRIEIDNVYDLLTYLRMDRADIVEAADGMGLNTDDNVRIEFSAPRYLHYDTAPRNNQLLEDAASGAFDQARDVLGTPDEEVTFLVGLAEAWEKRGIWFQAGSSYLTALERRPGDIELTERLARARVQMDEGEPE
ncbi:MAG: MFS transporter [Proteobacteria bacterium]|nr:MFS transporter [Pseudomonadota bacterium]